MVCRYIRHEGDKESYLGSNKSYNKRIRKEVDIKSSKDAELYKITKK